jgi:hypothetical protein
MFSNLQEFIREYELLLEVLTSLSNTELTELFIEILNSM